MVLLKEKADWLESIGAIERPWKHCKSYVPSTEMHYSVEYIEKPACGTAVET